MFDRIPSLQDLDVKKFIHTFLPITLWLPNYNLQKLRGDIIAGITVGIMIIPQSIAFANLSGLPPQYGLYAGLMPGIVYAIFGTSKDVSMGPTVTMALFTYKYNSSLEPVGASCLAFFIGLVLILMALLRLSFIANFMPTHVLSGFISAAAITIMTSQLRSLFGHEKPPADFIQKIVHFFKNIHQPNYWDLVMSICCLIYLAFFMWLSKRKSNDTSKQKSAIKKIWKKFIWFMGVGRSATVCILATIVAYVFYVHGYKNAFTLAGKLPKGLPTPQLPLQTVVTSNNETITVKNFIEGFGASLIILPTIQFIQGISIAKAFGKIYKYDVDSGQELLAIGLANLLGSFFGGWPVTGSFSRSAVNSASGAATPFSGLFTSLIIVLALSFLTPLFQYIPKPSLAAMIIMAVVTMVDFKTPRTIWKINKIDLIPLLLSFFGTFYQLEAGVLAGAVAALLIMVSREVKPKYDLKFEKADGCMNIYFKQTLSYPSVENLKDLLSDVLKRKDEISVVKLDMSQVQHVDYAIISSLKSLSTDFSAANVTLKFEYFSSLSLEKAFQKAGLTRNGEEELKAATDNRQENSNDNDIAHENGIHINVSQGNGKYSKGNLGEKQFLVTKSKDIDIEAGEFDNENIKDTESFIKNSSC